MTPFIARRKLRMINSAKRLDDLRIPPVNRLEALKGKLKGKLKGQHRIRINDQRQSCFGGSDAGAAGVGIVDYH